MKRPTITDIAREAGVSKGAVSYALNGRPGVSEATRQRITRIARELGWSPSSTARALSGGRIGTIGLVLDREPFFPALLDGLSSALLLQVATGPDAALAIHRRWHAERKVDGVLLTGPEGAAELVRIGLPAVLLGGPGGEPGVPSVRVDDTAAAGEALEYLAALGHRRVVRVAGAPVFADPAARAEAFTAAARRLGLCGAGEPGWAGARERGGFDASAAGVGELRWSGGRDGGAFDAPAAGAGQLRWAGDRGALDPPAPGAGEPWAGSLEGRGRLSGVGRFPDPPGVSADPLRPVTVHSEPCADTVRRVLATHPRPTALLCDTDTLAVAALAAAGELGLAVPRDLSIVSWDDTPLCRLVRPALSAISRPLAELGSLAVSLLRDVVDGSPAGDVCASRPRLITRGSTGPAR